MKFFKILVAVFIAIAMAGCSSDSSEKNLKQFESELGKRLLEHMQAASEDTIQSMVYGTRRFKYLVFYHKTGEDTRTVIPYEGNKPLYASLAQELADSAYCAVGKVVLSAYSRITDKVDSSEVVYQMDYELDVVRIGRRGDVRHVKGNTVFSASCWPHCRPLLDVRGNIEMIEMLGGRICHGSEPLYEDFWVAPPDHPFYVALSARHYW